VQRLLATATVIGLFEQWGALEQIRLAPGDSLINFSDGVTEAARNPEEYGEARLPFGMLPPTRRLRRTGRMMGGEAKAAGGSQSRPYDGKDKTAKRPASRLRSGQAGRRRYKGQEQARLKGAATKAKIINVLAGLPGSANILIGTRRNVAEKSEIRHSGEWRSQGPQSLPCRAEVLAKAGR